MKTCSVCNKEFKKLESNKKQQCKSCYRKEYMKEYRKKNSEKISEYNKEYKRNNKEKFEDYNKKYRKEYYKNNPVANKNQVLKKYGINKEEYDSLLAAQNECCKICGKHKSMFNKDLGVDHCHITNKVCGLLCSHCNRAIGYLYEDYDLILSAAEYVKENKVSKI